MSYIWNRKHTGFLSTLFQKFKTMIEGIQASIANIVKAGYKTNAFAPLVWFNAVADSLLIFGIKVCNNLVVTYIFVSVLCLLIIATFITYIVLLVKDPKLLQSEKYRIDDRKLDLIAQKGQGITINPVDLLNLEQSSSKKGGNDE